MKKIFTLICQLVVGFTFLFSGIVKAIDPVGTSIKLGEYLRHFGLGVMVDLTYPMSWILALLECALALHLLIGRHRLASTAAVLLFMAVMTPLTLYLALFNPVDDCGCFGDAVKLTNWQTFGKNVVLLSMSIWLYVHKDKHVEMLSRHFHTLYFYIQIIGVVILLGIGTWRLPFVDFRPYRPGSPILPSQSCVESEEPEYLVVYTKDGQDQTFSLDDLPNESEGWEFKETLVKESSSSVLEPSSGTLVLFDDEGMDVTREVLNDSGYVMLLLSPDLNTADEHDIDRIENLYEYSLEQGYPFYCITLRDMPAIDNWKFRTGSEYPFLYADQQIIETMIRCNPGFMLLHNGVILWKSQLSEIDVTLLASAKLSEQSLGQVQPIDRKMRVFLIIVWLIAPLLLYLPLQIIKVIHKNKTKNEKENCSR